jgi:hypothetical protein
MMVLVKFVVFWWTVAMFLITVAMILERMDKK